MSLRRPLVVMLALSTVLNGFITTTGRASEPLHAMIRKHVPFGHPQCCLTQVASEVTRLEADLRATGTITVKAPDVWGESNLMSYLQEYEKLLAASVQTFNETIQAFIARADVATLQGQMSLGQGLGGANAPAAPSATVIDLSKNTPDFFTTLSKAVASAPSAAGTANKGIGLEPTEVERQRSTFTKVNQALRRKNIGDDNSRMAGYGLYLFRVPVSVLPGRETFEGHSAVVTLRARLQIDRDHLRTTFPKLIIAEVVEDLAPLFQKHWNDTDPIDWNDACQSGGAAPEVAMYSPGHGLSTPGSRTDTSAAIIDLYGCEAVNKLFCMAKSELGAGGGNVPRQLEIRNFLNGYLTQVHLALSEHRANGESLYDSGALATTVATEAFVKGDCSGVDTNRQGWTTIATNNGLGTNCTTTTANACGTATGNAMVQAGWCLAAQAGILNYNLRETWRSMQRNGDAPGDPSDGAADSLVFFMTDCSEETLAAWQQIIRARFPLHVFTLDPDIEEQNVYDAFERRRDLQLAFAYAVASGNMNANCAMAFSRQLDLEMASIGLNRTTVGFTHGDDTFGWYFYPRVQSPPEERNNLAALGRLIWSTGPTEHYDMKHRQLEPGIRECEVLIAMPSFVPQLQFDVTTNWERLTKPGCVKRTYEEMLEQGRRLECVRWRLQHCCGERGFRPGDYERLLSRVDQLEAMLPLQTQGVAIPYEYELPSSELLNTGNEHLGPQLQDYYGLHYVSTGNVAEVFLTGRHFHPTQTFVVAAGATSTETAQASTDSSSGQSGQGSGSKTDPSAYNFAVSVSGSVTPPPAAGTTPPPTKTPTATPSTLDADVKVLSRELLVVRIHKVSTDLTDQPITLRVGTPAGISNELTIHYKSPAQSTPATGYTVSQRLMHFCGSIKEDKSTAWALAPRSPQITFRADGTQGTLDGASVAFTFVVERKNMVTSTIAASATLIAMKDYAGTATGDYVLNPAQFIQSLLADKNFAPNLPNCTRPTDGPFQIVSSSIKVTPKPDKSGSTPAPVDAGPPVVLAFHCDCGQPPGGAGAAATGAVDVPAHEAVTPADGPLEPTPAELPPPTDQLELDQPTPALERQSNFRAAPRTRGYGPFRVGVASPPRLAPLQRVQYQADNPGADYRSIQATATDDASSEQTTRAVYTPR